MATRGGSGGGLWRCFTGAVPRELAATDPRELRIPNDRDRAGPDCDGQDSVVHESSGLTLDRNLNSARQYANVGRLFRKAIRAYCDDVRRWGRDVSSEMESSILCGADGDMEQKEAPVNSDGDW